MNGVFAGNLPAMFLLAIRVIATGRTFLSFGVFLALQSILLIKVVEISALNELPVQSLEIINERGLEVSA